MRDGRTLYGTDPETAIVVLQSLGADVVGVNCSTGPQEMAEIVRKMKAVCKRSDFWQNQMLVCQKLVDGETVYDMGPEEFASFGPLLDGSGCI